MWDVSQLGQRIVAAARLAVVLHVEQSLASQAAPRWLTTIGGADPAETDASNFRSFRDEGPRGWDDRNRSSDHAEGEAA